jgi:hypothetical protein
MKRLTLAAATAAALIAIPPTAEAGTTKKIAGLVYFSDSVWSNQLDPGEPVVAFPLGCATPGEDTFLRCDYTIQLRFLPEGSPECSASETAGRFCDDEVDSCMAWVEFGRNVLPLRSTHDREEFGEHAFARWAFASVPIEHDPLILSSEVTDSLRGKRYQMLMIRSWELEIMPEGLCRLGIDAVYHQNSKSVYERGLLQP